MDYSMEPKEITNIKKTFATIEDIDVSMHEYIKEVFDIHTTNNEGMYKVPVIWAGAERAYQIKNNRNVRDAVGKLKLPLISVNRTSLEKDKSFKGGIQAHLEHPRGARGYKNGAFKTVSVLNQEKTSALAASESRKKNKGKIIPGDVVKKVYDVYYIPIPVYVKAMYDITLRSEYRQQMNDMVAPFISRTGQINHFVMKKDQNVFEAFIEPSFAQSDNLTNLGQDERKFETKITIKVLGFIVGYGNNNNERPTIVKKENIVEIKIPKDEQVFKEIPKGFKIITSIE